MMRTIRSTSTTAPQIGATIHNRPLLSVRPVSGTFLPTPGVKYLEYSVEVNFCKT